MIRLCNLSTHRLLSHQRNWLRLALLGSFLVSFGILFGDHFWEILSQMQAAKQLPVWTISLIVTLLSTLSGLLILFWDTFQHGKDQRSFNLVIPWAIENGICAGLSLSLILIFLSLLILHQYDIRELGSILGLSALIGGVNFLLGLASFTSAVALGMLGNCLRPIKEKPTEP